MMKVWYVRQYLESTVYKYEAANAAAALWRHSDVVAKQNDHCIIHDWRMLGGEHGEYGVISFYPNDLGTPYERHPAPIIFHVTDNPHNEKFVK
jgi:hypothetical protein